MFDRAGVLCPNKQTLVFLDWHSSTLNKIAFALISLVDNSLIQCFQFNFSSILIPRYLTFLEKWSLCLLSLGLITPSYFFFLSLKIIVSVFLTVKEILFALSQLDKIFKSKSISFVDFF